MSSDADQPGAPFDADVVILGASFAGIEVLFQLRRRAGARPPRVIVIDRQGEHGYLPLVQERLVDRIDPAKTELATASYIDSVPQARFVRGDITGFDAEAHRVTLADGRTFTGRIVVIALGSTMEPPKDLPGRELLLGYKSQEQFATLRAQLDRCLNAADEAPSIAVVGGGISGVELAGELAYLAARTRRPWAKVPRVTLVSAGSRLVPNLHRRAGDRVLEILRAQGVDVRLQARVSAAHTEGLSLLEAGEGGVDPVELPCALACWAGGIQPAPTLHDFGLPLTGDGWLAVGPTLQCFAGISGGDPRVFACGDAVRVVGGQGPWPTMQRAIECLWQAKVVAINVLRLLREPSGDPALVPHSLREDFPHGVSLGARSLVVWGALVVDRPRVNQWFRRWLMTQYFARYEPFSALNPPGAVEDP